MKYKFLCQRNGLSKPDLYRKYGLLYSGGQDFLDNIGLFLNKMPDEPEPHYRDRKAEAHYLPYAGPIVDVFSAEVFSAPLTITTAGPDGKQTDPDDFYASFKEDCDLHGHDLIEFFRERFVEALVYKRAWFVAELPSEDGISASSLLEEQDRELGRAVLKAVKPSDVLDWECDRFGGLLWVLTHAEEYRRPSIAAQRNLKTETWTLYDDKNVTTYEITYDPQKKQLLPNDEIPEVASSPHGFPRVPVIVVEVPPGLWLMDRAASAQVEHFRLSVGLDWAMRGTSYPLTCIGLADAGSEPKFGVGSALILSNQDKTWMLQPEAGPFDSIQNRIDVLRQEIFRIAHATALGVDNNAAAIGRSGESKAVDNSVTEKHLQAYGALICEAIEEVFELVSDARGDTEVTFSVSGLDRFNLDAVTQALNLLQVAKTLGVPSDTYKRQVAIRVADLSMPDLNQDDKDAIRDEILKADLTPPPIPVPGVAGDQQDEPTEEAPKAESVPPGKRRVRASRTTAR